MTGRPVKVLQVIDSLGMGGAETWLMEVLRRWSGKGEAQMDFLAAGGQRGLFDEEAAALGASIHYIPYGRRNLPAFSRAFRRLLAEQRYDAIHDHQDYSSGWHFLLGAGRLPPVRVTHVHNPAYQIRNNYGVSAVRRATGRIGQALVARFATNITGTSREVIGEYGFDGPAFARIPKAAIYCGFDTARFAALDRKLERSALLTEFYWPSDSIVALFAGRIDRSPDAGDPQSHKNAGVGVNVAIAAAKSDARFRALFAGAPSPATPVLEQRIAAHGLSDRIRLIGLRTDLAQLMTAADALLFPSRGEGLGMVAVEAQAASLPVLASATVPRECVVVPDMVRFKDLGESPAAWAAELLAIAGQPRRTDANDLVATSNFAIGRSADALLALYQGR